MPCTRPSASDDARLAYGKAQVTEIVASILSARPSQLSECYDARDPRAPLYSCAACGGRPIARPLSPYRRIALGDLVRVFEYEFVLAASESSAKASAERRNRAKRAAISLSFLLAPRSSSCARYYNCLISRLRSYAAPSMISTLPRPGLPFQTQTSRAHLRRCAARPSFSASLQAHCVTGTGAGI